MIETPQSVLAFWRAAGPKQWFNKDAAFDDEVRARFLPTHEAAAAGQLADWERTAEGALALVIALDQFPRNIFRGSARAFAADPLAREAADRAIAKGFDQEAPATERGFFYLPCMHSERLDDQERCVSFYRALGDPEGLKYAELHLDIIRKCGRFPHRNAALGRATTAEEQAFLDSGGFAG